jgi:hypothetical protein
MVRVKLFVCFGELSTTPSVPSIPVLVVPNTLIPRPTHPTPLPLLRKSLRIRLAHQTLEKNMGEVVNVLVAFAVIIFLFRWATSGMVPGFM